MKLPLKYPISPWVTKKSAMSSVMHLSHLKKGIYVRYSGSFCCFGRLVLKGLMKLGDIFRGQKGTYREG